MGGTRQRSVDMISQTGPKRKLKDLQIHVQGWYERRGYKVYKHERGYFERKNQAGNIWPLTAVFLRKNLV